MSLRVWLPLNDNLDNQGLGDITITNNGATVDNSGKIGKCYSFGTSTSYLTLSNDAMNGCTTECSLSFWLNITSWNTSYATYFQAGLGGAPWNHYIFGVLRNGTASNLCFTISNGSSASNASYTTPNLELNTWYYLTFIYKTGHCLIYVNGVSHQDYTTTIVPNFSEITKTTVGICNNGSSYQTNCKINDLRIYDHALSAKEVKLLSQGLVAHYTLDDSSVQTLDNCYVYPTFDTTATNGGWYHWGRSGHIGTYGQNTDKQYIFRKEQTYSHWVANGEGATGEYLCYQSPAFDGGYRSLCIIAKEENSEPITEDILFPAWNSGTGSVPSGKWTSIQDLGDGFYLCKVDGFQQTGSNDLVGVYVRAGYKVYLSEGYLENNKKACSDIFYNTNIIYDSSGYCNNGTVHGDLTISPDTPRYSISTVFDGDSACIQIPNLYEMLGSNSSASYSVSVWTYKSQIGSKGYQTILGGSSGFEIEARNGSENDPKYVLWNWGKISAPYEFNRWNHMVFTKQASDVKLYVNGVLANQGTSSTGLVNSTYFIGAWNTATQQNYDGQMSDFRIYATALSAEQVAELYNTSISVANNGTLMGYELVEV